jgi:hypothetical protein
MNKNIFVILFMSFLFISFLTGATYATTYSDAEIAINNSKLIIQEFTEKGFSTAFISDTLSEAERTLESARYAEILRNFSSSLSQMNTARQALRLVDWKNLSYDNVIYYTNIVENRKIQAYDIFDKLNALWKKIDLMNYNGINVSSAVSIFNEANNSFHQDRYTESQTLIDKTNLEIEKITSDNSTFRVLGRNTKGFFYNYWYVLLIILAVMGYIFYILYKIISKNLIKKKIIRMRAEFEVLKKLLVKNQEERFKENKISGLVYNIRAKKYEEKINEIKELLPVLEAKLKDKVKKE